MTDSCHAGQMQRVNYAVGVQGLNEIDVSSQHLLSGRSTYASHFTVTPGPCAWPSEEETSVSFMDTSLSYTVRWHTTRSPYHHFLVRSGRSADFSRQWVSVLTPSSG